MRVSCLVFLLSTFVANAKSYQVGEYWSKKHIAKASKRAQKLKESIGEVGARATLFYIGKINNKHWAITNHHVCPALSNSSKLKANRCNGQWIKFFYYKNQRGYSLNGFINKVPLIIKSLDLALLEITFNNLSDFSRPPKALKFSDKAPLLNQELISIGYGGHNNEYGTLMVEEDSFECQVFSSKTQLRKDPDTLNPVSYEVHSFLHGCDVSHGDSGSPIIDRRTYDVVGLLWSGKFPKHESISRYGFETLPLQFLWKELNYASPGFMIKQKLDSYFNDKE